VESAVGGGVMLVAVLSELLELSLLFPQAVKTPAIATVTYNFFIIDLWVVVDFYVSR
jgi:hypothetical protein